MRLSGFLGASLLAPAVPAMANAADVVRVDFQAATGTGWGAVNHNLIDSLGPSTAVLGA